MAAAEETVVLNLNLAAETEGAPEAIAKVGEALKGLATDADEAKKALARVTPAESLNQMADWVSKTAGADAAAKLMQNMTQEGNSLGAALEKTGEAAAVTAPAIAAVAQETAAAVPIVEASVAVTEQATTAERAHENALKMLSSGIKEYGLQAEGARELVEAFAKDEELTAEETTGLQRELGLLGDATEETGQVTKATGIAFGEMFGDMAAASKGAQESKGILQDVADEGSAATDIVGQAHTALRSMRVALGAVGADPALTALVGQATGLAGVLDVIAPSLTLLTNPVVIAATAAAAVFFLEKKLIMGNALEVLERTLASEKEQALGVGARGLAYEVGGRRVDVEKALGYKPYTPFWGTLEKVGIDFGSEQERIKWARRSTEDWKRQEEYFRERGPEAFNWFLWQMREQRQLREKSMDELAGERVTAEIIKRGDEERKARIEMAARESRPDLFPQRDWFQKWEETQGFRNLQAYSEANRPIGLLEQVKIAAADAKERLKLQEDLQHTSRVGGQRVQKAQDQWFETQTEGLGELNRRASRMWKSLDDRGPEGAGGQGLSRLPAWSPGEWIDPNSREADRARDARAFGAEVARAQDYYPRLAREEARRVARLKSQTIWAPDPRFSPESGIRYNLETGELSREGYTGHASMLERGEARMVGGKIVPYTRAEMTVRGQERFNELVESMIGEGTSPVHGFTSRLDILQRASKLELYAPRGGYTITLPEDQDAFGGMRAGGATRPTHREQTLIELGKHVEETEARVRREPVPVIIVNPENTLGKAFKQGRRLEQVDQGL